MAAPIAHYPEPSIATNELTIGRLLDESLMAGACLVSGVDQLDRELTSILPLTEVPSVPHRLDTVGLYARPEVLTDNVSLLTALASRGVALLLVDGPIPDEFAGLEVPAELIVVEMAARVGFAALSRLVAKLTLDAELQAMRYSMHVHALLAKQFHRGAGLDILIREVCNLARNPAMVLDESGRVLAHVGLRGNQLESLSASAARVLASGGQAARRSINPGSRVDRVVGTNGGAWTSIAHEIKLCKGSQGWVVVLVPLAILNSEDLGRHRVLTEQAAAVIGLELQRQRSVEEAEERARDDFIQALLHGSFFSDHELRARAEHHEIDPDSPFGVFVTGDLLPKRVGNRASRMARMARYAANISADTASRADATVLGNVLVVIRQLRETEEPARSREMAAFAQSMCAALEEHCGKAVAVAYGHPARDATEISDRYGEAQIALDVAHQLGRTCACSYQELRSFTMLAGVTGSESSRQLIEQYIDPLRSGPNLIGTLASYLDQGANVTEAARALNVHRNTLLTKLDRISRAIGMDIREPEVQFTARLAIMLDTLATGTRQQQVPCPV